jgi:hypothetical protein
LGDPNEARLSAALNYSTTASCPAPSSTPASQKAMRRPLSATDGIAVKQPGKQLLILRR